MACCEKCKKGPPEVPLKQCAKCNVTTYCSRDCQKADWKTHKKICSKQSNPGHPGPSTHGASPHQGTDQPATRPFTRLQNRTWLHDRSERDVYRLLIDAYRMRADDLFTMEGVAEPGSVYGGAADSGGAFARFLDRVEQAGRGILPSWWNAEKRAECIAMGLGGEEWQSLKRRLGKADVQEHYGDPRFPMQLRMFAESVYGVAPGGHRGDMMLGMMASMER
ncbi:hypothetical protein QBC39DRAFT_251694 [Podospora conica]|nr:hypothetical protein QBC39DRAFT_251694 [Schizothecium conicum]